jgi:hypothetical protein
MTVNPMNGDQMNYKQTTGDQAAEPMTSSKRPMALAADLGRHRRVGVGPGRVALTLTLALVGTALLGGACTHAHLSPNYGLAYNAWFTAQHAHGEAADSDATKRALSTLDAQEAASISRNYRRVVSGGQGDGAGQGQMLTVGQGRGGNETYLPPPSVPGGN